MPEGWGSTNDKGNCKLEVVAANPPELDMKFGTDGNRGSVGSQTCCGGQAGKKCTRIE